MHICHYRITVYRACILEALSSQENLLNLCERKSDVIGTSTQNGDTATSAQDDATAPRTQSDATTTSVQDDVIAFKRQCGIIRDITNQLLSKK